jgi:hypothetical protein
MIKFTLLRPPPLQMVDLNVSDMRRIGARAIQSVQERCAKGLNVNDRRAKPLSKNYQKKKLEKGQPGIRNLMYSGAMLGALTIVESSTNRVVIGFTRMAEQIKAAANQEKDPWFGLSNNDQGKVEQFADRVLQDRAAKLSK